MKKLDGKTYETPLKGYTALWCEPVEIIGEEKYEDENGKILDCYIYEKPHAPTDNGLPFVALKVNITVR